MSNDIAIRVENLGKRYIIGKERPTPKSMGGKLGRLAASPFDWLRGQIAGPSEDEIFWALKDVSFEVKRGEVLGVIGRNGAGKSTLLKILSRITEPTTGFAEIHGRIGALLEVGTGMHPELTGRENIFMNGTVLGMKRWEIKDKFDEIVDFSGIEKFIDTPVKRYSSGMRVRLGFAIAAHLEPEILIVDEVLAVGDADFQKKCLGKMKDVAGHGRTVLFVSHNMTAVRSLCSHALRLEEGKLKDDNDVSSVVSAYLSYDAGSLFEQKWEKLEDAPGNELVRIKSIRLTYDGVNLGASIFTDMPISIRYEFWTLKAGETCNISTHLRSLDNVVIFNVWSEMKKLSTGTFSGTLTIPGNFLNDGIYVLDFMVVINAKPQAFLNPGVRFEVHDRRDNMDWHGKVKGAVRPTFLKFDLESL